MFLERFDVLPDVPHPQGWSILTIPASVKPEASVHPSSQGTPKPVGVLLRPLWRPVARLGASGPTPLRARRAAGRQSVLNNTRHTQDTAHNAYIQNFLQFSKKKVVTRC